MTNYQVYKKSFMMAVWGFQVNLMYQYRQHNLLQYHCPCFNKIPCKYISVHGLPGERSRAIMALLFTSSTCYGYRKSVTGKLNLKDPSLGIDRVWSSALVISFVKHLHQRMLLLWKNNSNLHTCYIYTV